MPPNLEDSADEPRPADEHGEDNPFNYSSVKEVFTIHGGNCDTLSNSPLNRSTGDMTDLEGDAMQREEIESDQVCVLAMNEDW